MHLVLPLNVQVTKSGKKFALNLNQYRNTHFQTLNKAKVLFKDLLWGDVSSLGKSPYEKIQLTYWLFLPTKQRADVSNVCAIVDKFFSDVLVEVGFIEDDNIYVLPKVIYEFRGIDRNHPRVEVFIHEYSPSHEDDMKIQKIISATLTEEDVIAAIGDYVAKAFGGPIAVRNVSINGDMTAEVSVEELDKPIPRRIDASDRVGEAPARVEAIAKSETPTKRLRRAASKVVEETPEPEEETIIEDDVMVEDNKEIIKGTVGKEELPDDEYQEDDEQNEVEEETSDDSSDDEQEEEPAPSPVKSLFKRNR